MDAREQAEQEAAIVRAVAANVADVMDGEWGMREWLHLFVDFEIDASGERSSTICFALARHQGEPVEKIAFRLPYAAKQILATLAGGMALHNGDRWTVVRIRIERDGRFTFDYGYEAPYRLGGALIDTRYEDYLKQWLERDTEARGPPRSGWRKWLGRGRE